MWNRIITNIQHGKIMIELKNKYIVGTHIMFYEIEMVEEYIIQKIVLEI